MVDVALVDAVAVDVEMVDAAAASALVSNLSTTSTIWTASVDEDSWDSKRAA